MLGMGVRKCRLVNAVVTQGPGTEVHLLEDPRKGKHGQRLENETQSKGCEWNPGCVQSIQNNLRHLRQARGRGNGPQRSLTTSPPSEGPRKNSPERRILDSSPPGHVAQSLHCV